MDRRVTTAHRRKFVRAFLSDPAINRAEFFRRAYGDTDNPKASRARISYARMKFTGHQGKDFTDAEYEILERIILNFIVNIKSRYRSGG